jgi:hypothetical protein
MTQHTDLFLALAAPFGEREVKSRPQGRAQLHYVTARTVMNRLDTVLGPENWWDDYVPAEKSVLCRLTIRLPDGSTLTKCDAGGYAGMADTGDDEKSGYSDAFKRAAVKFGVGRYLYDDGVPAYGREPEPVQARNGKDRIDWPKCQQGHETPPPQHGEAAPRTGSALWRWARTTEEERGPGVVRWLSDYGRQLGFPARMVDWDRDDVARAYREVSGALPRIYSDQYDGEPYDETERDLDRLGPNGRHVDAGREGT